MTWGHFVITARNAEKGPQGGLDQHPHSQVGRLVSSEGHGLLRVRQPIRAGPGRERNPALPLLLCPVGRGLQYGAHTCTSKPSEHQGPGARGRGSLTLSPFYCPKLCVFSLSAVLKQFYFCFNVTTHRHRLSVRCRVPPPATAV